MVWSMGNVEWPDTYLGLYQKSLVGVLDENREAATGGVLLVKLWQPQACNFIKKDSGTGVFLWILRNC